MIQILHYALLILGNSDLFRQLKFENSLINKKVTLSYHFINNIILPNDGGNSDQFMQIKVKIWLINKKVIY